jgi:hypothetical protein
MTQDARQSLVAFGSVFLCVVFAVVSLRLTRGFDIPDWVLPLGLLLMTINLGWQGVQWLRSRRDSGKANGN